VLTRVVAHYRRLAPHPDLARLVEHYWTVSAPAPPEELRAILIPNGRATLQFCLGESGRRLQLGSAEERVNADVFLPVTTEPCVLAQSGLSEYVGVQFTPCGPAMLWPNVPSTPAPIGELSVDRPSAEALADDPQAALDAWLLGMASSAEQEHHDCALASEAVQLIEQDNENLSVSDLAVTLAISRPTLYRAFVRWIGISPKQYIAVRRYCRFASALLTEANGDSRSMLAAASGYCDESHAAREFKRHTGMSARTFRHRLDGIAALMFRNPPAETA